MQMGLLFLNHCQRYYKFGWRKMMFENAMLPDEITLPSGYVIKRPDKWI